ncbi:AcrR family transcriptional regulator [Kineosphaera limosa]|uniref:TetR/AcrR family transcriptional regulator n=1 Tax=Kineosphaera limosa TaxID=111564 RepID=UPI00031113E2|nr:TetR/AcrR family transcriptional regulator [Kineosphaera limosa]NYE01345.1 AcrR family transcriptional regulator [Kineosphaera limosa]
MSTSRQRSTTATASTPRQRLVDVAVARILREGMSVSLEHLSLEKVIAESGVSRATAYRQWPNKADFLREVLVSAVRGTRLVAESPRELGQLADLLRVSGEALSTPQGRRDLVVEALRVSAQADFERIHASPHWQTYLAITATCRGLPAGTLRDDVQAALAQTEASFLDHRAAVYARLPALLGYRLVPPLAEPEGFRVMAGAAGAMMTGLIVNATAAAPKGRGGGGTIRLAPFGSTKEAHWSLPALHLVTVFFAYLEPDPDAVWSRERIRAAAAQLDELILALAVPAKR